MSWRRCPSWPDYEVSEHGDVRRVVVANNGAIGVRKPYTTCNGYDHIVMRHAGAKQACAIHRLVAEAFLGPPPFKGAQVAHADGNKRHNHFRNLRWATRSANERDKVAHGRTKLHAHNVEAIKFRLEHGESCLQIGADFGVARQTINSIRTGRSWAWICFGDKAHG